MTYCHICDCTSENNLCIKCSKLFFKKVRPEVIVLDEKGNKIEAKTVVYEYWRIEWLK